MQGGNMWEGEYWTVMCISQKSRNIENDLGNVSFLPNYVYLVVVAAAEIVPGQATLVSYCYIHEPHL